jgi:hypothetical protein
MTFAEYKEFRAALKDLQDHSIFMTSELTQAFSELFDRFVSRHQGPQQVGLGALNAAGKAQARSMRHLHGTLKSLPTDLEVLKDLWSKWHAKKVRMDGAQATARSSAAELQKAEARKARALPHEIGRTSEQVLQAKIRYDNDFTIADGLIRSFLEFQEDYQTAFVDTFCGILDSVVDTELAQLREVSASGAEIVRAVEQDFPEVEDERLVDLRRELADLEEGLRIMDE